MKVKLYSSRKVNIETLSGGYIGTRYEQNATILEFDFSDLNIENIESMTKTIHLVNKERKKLWKD